MLLHKNMMLPDSLSKQYHNQSSHILVQFTHTSRATNLSLLSLNLIQIKPNPNINSTKSQ